MAQRAADDQSSPDRTRGDLGPPSPPERAPRFFPSDWSRAERRVYGSAVVWFLAIFVGLLWPVYPAFSGIHPLVFGLPLSLAYVVALLVLSFLGTLALYLWEGRRGRRRDRGGSEGAP